jgi:hypothetical protein
MRELKERQRGWVLKQLKLKGHGAKHPGIRNDASLFGTISPKALPGRIYCRHQVATRCFAGRLNNPQRPRDCRRYRETEEDPRGMSSTTMTVRADHVRPGDAINGKAVVFAIPNPLRSGKTEIHFANGSAEFLPDEGEIKIVRSAGDRTVGNTPTGYRPG